MYKKRFFALFLAASMVMSAAVFPASAAENVQIIEEDAVVTDAEALRITDEVELTVNGQVGSITVTEDGEESEITLASGAVVGQILVEGEDAEINVESGASVQAIVLNAEAEVEGNGTVGTVTVNAEEAEIDVPGTKVIVGGNAEEVEAGDVELKPGDIVVINPDGNGVTPWEPEVPELHEPVLSVQDITLGEAIVITCGTEAHGCEFFAKLQSVKIIAPNGNTDNVLPDGQESVFEKIGYTVSENLLTIGEDTLKQDFALNADGSFAAGLYTVTLTAEGYGEKTVTLNVAAPAVEPPVEPTVKAAPTVANVERLGGMMGQYDRLSFNEDVTEYLPAITSVTVNGTSVKKVTNLFGETFAYKLSNDPAYGGADKFLEFTTDCLTGSYSLVIEANGYETLTYPQAVEPEVPAVLPVPGYHHFEFKADMFRGDHYRLSFNAEPIVTVDAVTAATGGVGPIVPPLPEPTPEMKALYAYVSSLKTYLNEVKDSSITVNGVEVQESPNATLENYNSFLVIADEHDMSRNAVVFNLDCFDNKENAQVVIKVAGYEDLVLTVSGRKVETQQPEPEVPQGELEAPTAQSMEHRYSSFSGNSYVVKLADPANPVQDHTYTFLRNLTKVTVNGVAFTKAGSFGKLGDTNYTVNASAREFVVSENGFGNDAGTFEVTLTAAGYKALTFWVIDGKLSTVAPLPAAPVVLRLEHKTGFSGSGYVVKLANSSTDDQQVYNFLGGLTEVSVNGTVYSAAGGFRPKPDATHYTMNRSAGEITFSEESFGSGTGVFTVVLKAQGFQNLTFTVENGVIPTV